jgi:predicted  nucleic acid-binding Zn-ribbon protein
MNLFFSEPIYQFVFIISCLSFIMSVVSIRESLSDAKNKIKDLKKKEKNVKDMHRYNQLLDPPDAEMNN